MKKKQLNLRKLALKKSTVAGFKTDQLNGGTGTSYNGCPTIPGEPCFQSDFGDCGGGTTGNNTTGNGTGNPTPTQQGCPPQTLLCASHSICPPGVYCY